MTANTEDIIPTATTAELTRRRAALAEWLDEYADRGHDSGFDEGCTPGMRYLLIEENVRGGFWLSTFDDPETAADYHANQEYAGEWTATELLVDLDTGLEYWPGPATFVWQEKPAAESRGPRA